ncbi:MAG TPA: trypsin-like peptidase domain-containing protein [Solirubrobacteraceae bacterium]|nr:trypsin-like peptidase domain-containing protein [Solirubrobacteraceae bacterium]
MNRSSRLSNVFFTFLGAASVGLVIAVLALAGVFESTERVVTQAPRTSTTAVSEQRAADGSVSQIYAQTAPGVAFIQNRGNGGSGSGFLIDAQGHVVTNAHVVDGGSSFTVRFGEDGDALTAKLIGKDESTDLAVLEIDPKQRPAESRPLELASSSALRPGDVAIAIGSPFGLSGSVTTGVISALHRTITAPNGFQIEGVLQTDAAINPGNSGGPLLDAEGRVIGVNSQIAASSARQSSGVGFAVPVDTVNEVVPELIRGGDIERAYLGVSSTLDPDDDGAVVDMITPDGPAAASELRTGDRITAVDGAEVKEPSDLSSAVLKHKPGERVELTVVRDGEQRTIEVELGTRPDQLAQG